MRRRVGRVWRRRVGRTGRVPRRHRASQGRAVELRTAVSGERRWADGYQPAIARTADAAARHEIRPRRLRVVRQSADVAGRGQGNMAATTAEGEGNRFIAIAVETSEAVSVNDPDRTVRRSVSPAARCVAWPRSSRRRRSTACRRWAPIGCCRRRSTASHAPAELYNYVASFGTFLVIVTANPLVLPDKPVEQVDTQRARDLLTAAVAAVKG